MEVRLPQIGLGVVGLGSLAAAGVYRRLWRRPLPQTQGTLELSGLRAPAVIARDRWGVPSIRAASRHDAWFCQGVCHGQDRLFQLDFYRRIAAGRLAEVAGPAALPADRLMRTLGLHRLARAEERGLSPAIAEALEAYAAGVNAAARAARSKPFELHLLRREFEPWRPADSLALAKLLAFGLSTNWEQELLRAQLARDLGPERAAAIDPRYPAGNPIVLAPDERWSGDGLGLVEQITAVREAIGLGREAGGSNNWAVSGERTVSGAPLLAGDPHLTAGMPGIWYQASIAVDERWARGASPPGMPGVWIGQNNDVAWSFTNVMADVMDVFVERVDGDGYEFEGGRRPLEHVREPIDVRGRQTELLDVRLTHHGPLVDNVLGEPADGSLALRWTCLDTALLGDAVPGVLDVRSGPELVESMRAFVAPVSNLVWADRHGSIGYKLVGRIPLRRGGCPDLPKPGWSGAFEWDGVVPYDELPALVDPPAGFVVTANNRIAPAGYPHHITSEYLDGYRARRCTELIQATPRHDVDSFRRMQIDEHSIPGLETARRLARLTAGEAREREALERLRAWDGRMDAGTVAGTIYQAFTLRLARGFATAVIGDRKLVDRWLDRSTTGFLEHSTAPWRWQSHLLALWERGETELTGRPWDELVHEAFAAALDDLERAHGRAQERWRWGDVHGLRFPHPLGQSNRLLRRLLDRRLRTGGAQETVNQIAYDPNAPFAGLWAPSYRLIADLGDPARSRWQSFTGQSGHPASPHYDDLQPRWLRGETQPLAGEGPWRELQLRP